MMPTGAEPRADSVARTAPPPAEPRVGRPLRRAALRHVTAMLAWLALALPPGSAAARESDLAQAIEVRADRSEYDERAGTQVLIGNVEISQGTMRISAERVEISLKDSKLAGIEGSGSPIRFEQENETGERIRGEARDILYDATDGTLVLSGAATLAQPGQSLSSERIVFDARTQRVTAEGGAGDEDGERGRVSIRIEPPSGTSEPR